MGRHEKLPEDIVAEPQRERYHTDPRHKVVITATRAFTKITDAQLQAGPVPRTADIRLIAHFIESDKHGILRKVSHEEIVSNSEARAILTEIRDMADAHLQNLWGREEPQGRHEKEN